MSEKLNSSEMSGRIPLTDQSTDVSINLMAPQGNQSSPDAWHFFSSQFHYLQFCSNYSYLLSADHLPTNPRPIRAITAGDTLESIVLPIAGLDAKEDISLSHTSSACKSKRLLANPLLNWSSDSSFPAVGTSEINPFVPTLSNINAKAASHFSKAPMIGYSMLITEKESASTSKYAQNEILKESLALIEKKSADNTLSSAEHDFKVMISSKEARARNTANDRRRRARITEGIKALQNALPCSDKGRQESVLDDIVDYIKFLKLQLKALSQSRLSGEAMAYPFVHLEGFGHYLVHQHNANEPLEEILGQLMDSNTQAANGLFESKGLAVLPMALAYALLRTSEGLLYEANSD